MRIRTLFPALLLLLTACGKYPDGPDFSMSRRSVRVEGNWKVHSATQVVNGVTTDMTAYYSPWRWVYNSNGDIRILADFGNGPEYYNGAWKFDLNDTRVTVLTFPELGDSATMPYWVEDNIIYRLKKDEFWIEQHSSAKTLRLELEPAE